MTLLDKMGSGWIFLVIVVGMIIITVSLVQKKQAIATKIALALSIFLVISVGYVYISSGTSIGSFNDFVDFVSVYFSWLGSVFGNLKAITTNAVSLEWGSNNTIS